MDDWLEEPYYSPMTLEQIKAHMDKRNSRRWRRLKSDYEWLEKEMRKLRLNPHDARYLL